MKPISRRTVLKIIGKSLVGTAFLGLVAKRANAQETTPAPKIISTRGHSVKSIIESYPAVNEKEISLYKMRGTRGEIIDGMYERSTHGTKVKTPLPEKLKSIIHTHIIENANPNLSRKYKIKRMMYLSPKDFRAFNQALEKGAIKKPIVFHVATINEKGKVMLYTSMRFGEKFLEQYYKNNPELHNTIKEICQINEEGLKNPEQIDAYNSLVNKLKNHGAIIKTTKL